MRLPTPLAQRRPALQHCNHAPPPSRQTFKYLNSLSMGTSLSHVEFIRALDLNRWGRNESLGCIVC
jgi:hypothetical protein